MDGKGGFVNTRPAIVKLKKPIVIENYRTNINVLKMMSETCETVTQEDYTLYL